MAISGKDCDRIARELLDVRPAPLGSRRSTLETGELVGWLVAVHAIAHALHDRMGLNLNGNRRFQRERFMKAAGAAEEDR